MEGSKVVITLQSQNVKEYIYPTSLRSINSVYREYRLCEQCLIKSNAKEMLYVL